MRNLLITCMMLLHLNAAAINTPFICFTDINSGPATGNSDHSQPGQSAGQDGAIVTIWGKNLGSSQGSSQVLTGGIPARIYRWANATAPAQLYTKLGMQMIEFQIPGTLPNGITTLQVVVNGISSNSVSFTIRSGNIYFIKTTGNDLSGNGSWDNPWTSLDNTSNTGALDKINAGDIIYICDGVSHTALAGDRATIDLGNPGTAALPKAIVGYPGAAASVGNPEINNAYSLWVSGFGPTINWVISKLYLTAKDGAANMYHNFRLVGNKITAPNGSEPTGAIAASGNNLYILGNELTNIGFAGTSKLYHPIYIQSAEACSGPRLPTETNRELAWNYLHDNFSYDGINIYRECSSSAYMTNHRVHDNYIENQTGCGIRIGDYVTGENWIYNNIVENAGIGPNPAGDQAMHIPVFIHAGWDDTTTIIHFYNNTIVGGGFNGGAAWASSMVGFSNSHPYTLDFRNNIIVSTVPGVTYLNPALWQPTGAQRNLWHGAGTAPVWDNNSINTDPLFVNSAAGDFRLLTNSPAKDVALPISATSFQPLPTLDFDAKNRPQNGITDIGAFEFSSEVVLPLSWLAVKADRINAHEAILQWRVANQQQVKDYQLQQRVNAGMQFTNVCSMAATTQELYSCRIPVLESMNYLFRVMQTDTDGRSSYSPVVKLTSEKDEKHFRLLSNPATDQLKLVSNLAGSKKINFNIYDAKGALVQENNFSSSSTAGSFMIIPVYDLRPGLYSLFIQYDGGTELIPFIKH
ncbi:MAG: IPT/TIG domain-containing protein [Ferruginibacter sp.]